ncbi:MAG TPA: hypothetical protein VGS21_00565, partial [Acidimicrobiales bacterium]|nr:hypothetical protein [Acidimicrobiales bacterium]
MRLGQSRYERWRFAAAALVAASGAAVIAPGGTAGAVGVRPPAATSPGPTSPARQHHPLYRLVDLTSKIPAGYNTLIPVAINRSGEVAGDVFSGGTPANSDDEAIVHDRAPVQSTSAVPAVPHVFVYSGGRIRILALPDGLTSGWFAGLNDLGELTVVGCYRKDCGHYYFVARPTSGRTYRWIRLPGADAGPLGLGGIADDGTVAGSIRPVLENEPVQWKPLADGRYGTPAELPVFPAGTWHNFYFPAEITSVLGVDVMGGAEETLETYPHGSPAIWGTKIARDYGQIGSQTTAIGGFGSTVLAAVGCLEPVAICSPSCPDKPIIFDISVRGGKPILGRRITLEDPGPRYVHCGVSPLGVAVGPRGGDIAVGLAAVVSG